MAWVSMAPKLLCRFKWPIPLSLVQTNNAAFNNLGGSSGSGPFSSFFDWGLPFFFGRTVFVGIEGQTSPLGTGPYFAF